MSENIQPNLFHAGMTREQFIDEYTAGNQVSEDCSVFSNGTASLVGRIFDYLDKNKNNTLDETEINDLTNADIEDGGENVLNESDFTAIYEKLMQDESQVDTDPAEMYNNALKTGQTPDDYLRSTTQKLTLTEELIEARKTASESKINRYQKQIDDLIARSTTLGTDFKQDYKTLSDEIRQLKKEAAQKNDKISAKQREIDEKSREIKCIEAETDSLDPDDKNSAEKKQNEISVLNSEISGLQSECAGIKSELSAITSKIQKKQNELNSMNAAAKAKDSSLEIQINTLENKILKEKEDLSNDLAVYETNHSVYQSAQEYASTQIVSTADLGSGNEPDLTLSKNAEELKSKWSKSAPNLSDNFYQKVMDISSNLGCDADVLMALMRSESGLDSTAVNKSSGSTGLIQFMPSTAKSLGTTTQALKEMSAVQQLDYVEKYLTNAKKSAGLSQSDKLDAGTLYTLVFLPAYAKRDVLAVSGDKYYNANSGLDTDKNGQITKNDLGQRLTRLIPS